MSCAKTWKVGEVGAQNAGNERAKHYLNLINWFDKGYMFGN